MASFRRRRAWLCALLLHILSSGCAARRAAHAPRDVVQAFASALAEGRLERAYALLSPAQRETLTLDDFKSIQHEHTSLPGRALARLLKEVDLGDPKLEPYAKLLTEWDGVLSRESRAGPLYAVWLQELQDAFYAAHVPADLLD